MLKVGRLGIGRLRFGYEGSFYYEELQAEHLLSVQALVAILPLVPPFIKMVPFPRRLHPFFPTHGPIIFIEV
jgi:hypothetical protein